MHGLLGSLEMAVNAALGAVPGMPRLLPIGY